MKKLVLAMLVVALAAPALANVQVTAEATATPGELLITVDPAGGTVRGIALWLTTDAGDAVLANSADVEVTGFNTFIDFASEVAAYEVGQGHPVAQWDAAGTTFSGAKFSLSAGFLDEGGNQAGLTAPATFTVQYALSTNSTIGIEFDTIRGGVVGENLGTPVIVNETVELPVSVQPICLGDINNDGFINLQDMSMMIGMLSTKGAPYVIPSNDPAFNAAADINQDGFVNLQDMSMMIGMLSTQGAPYVIPCP